VQEAGEVTMARKLMTVEEVKGSWAIMPTPAKANGADWRATDTVDLDETARIAENLVRSGVDGILTLGTFGECSTLLDSEKRDFLGTVVETVNGRIPVFGGGTALGTRSTVEQCKAAYDIGANGVMVGPPMWCECDVPTAVQFYRDIAEACPELAICIYANPEAFKFDFPRPFWAQVSNIPQVISAKYLGIGFLTADLRLTKGRVRLMPVDTNYYAAARVDPEQCTAFWTSGAVCGPAPTIKLRELVAIAKQTNDWTAAKALTEKIAAANSSLFPKGSFAEFSKYNIPLEKMRINAAGWAQTGPSRPPYNLVPDDYAKGAIAAGKAWADLHRECLEA